MNQTTIGQPNLIYQIIGLLKLLGRGIEKAVVFIIKGIIFIIVAAFIIFLLVTIFKGFGALMACIMGANCCGYHRDHDC